jgi:hypothetical protein
VAAAGALRTALGPPQPASTEGAGSAKPAPCTPPAGVAADAAGPRVGRAVAPGSDWAEAQRSGYWPTLPNEILTAHPPGYAEAQWLERAMSDPEILKLPIDPFHEPLPSQSASLDGALIP